MFKHMDTKHFYDFLIRIQAIAKTGLVYSKDEYALTNYKEINDLSTKMLEEFLEVNFDRPNYFTKDVYPTPNISCRTVILNKDNTKVLYVKEVNGQAYSLPGGWCDVYDSPSKAALNECIQEAGAEVKIERLLGVINRTPFKTSVNVPEYAVIFLAHFDGELKEHEYETCEVNWYNIENIPPLSRKMSKMEVKRILDAATKGETIFD